MINGKGTQECVHHNTRYASSTNVAHFYSTLLSFLGHSKIITVSHGRQEEASF